MQKVVFSFLLLVSLTLSAQVTPTINKTVPKGISYQGVFRDGNDPKLAPIPNQSIVVNFQIRQKSTTAVLYQEIHNAMTNKLGIFTCTIGTGDVSPFSNAYKNLDTIPWANLAGDISMTVRTGTSSTTFNMGETVFLTVPYAFHSADGLQWLGDTTAAPTNTIAIDGSAYYNKTDKVTYYKRNGAWDTLAYAGDTAPILWSQETNPPIRLYPTTNQHVVIGDKTPSNNPLLFLNAVNGDTALRVRNNSTNAPAVLIDNLTDAGNGLKVHNSNSSNTRAAVLIDNEGVGKGLSVASNNTQAIEPTLYVQSNSSVSTGHGIFVDKQGNGNAIKAVSDANEAVINAVRNNGSGYVIDASSSSSSNTDAVVKVASTSGSASAIAATVGNAGTGNVLNVVSNNGNNTNSAVLITDNSKGNSIEINKNGNTGNAIRAVSNSSLSTVYIENTNNTFSNPKPTLEVNSNTKGEAVLINNTNAGSMSPALLVKTASNTALQIENGHLAAITAIEPVISYSSTNGSVTSTTITVSGNNNDVRGKIIVGPTLFLNANESIVIHVQFIKNYDKVPYVSITPMDKLNGLNFYTSNITATGFDIVVNSPISGFSGSIAPLKFSYFVIE